MLVEKILLPTAIYSFHFAALWHLWMQISGDKTIQFLTQQYMFANVLGGTEVRTGSVPEVQKDPQGPIFRL